MVWEREIGNTRRLLCKRTRYKELT
jgi:hypothetical protein